MKIWDIDIPDHNKNKEKGYKMSLCGYQRKLTTKEYEKVTCKLCLKELNREGKLI